MELVFKILSDLFKNSLTHFQVQHAQHKSHQALQTLNRAITMDPNNPLCKFHRASIFFATERYQDALRELEELKQIIPKESLVYFIMGKVGMKFLYMSFYCGVALVGFLKTVL